MRLRIADCGLRIADSEVEKLAHRIANVPLHGLRKLAQVVPEQIVVPRQNLIDEYVAVCFQPAGPLREPHAQWKRIVDEPRRQWKNHSARQPGLAERRRLDGQARPRLA